MSAQIRLATESDAEDIASVLFESFKEYEPFYVPETFAATTPSADQIRERMQEGPIWIALVNNQCQGTITAVPQGETLYIRAMAVLPSARRQHIGEAMLKQVENWALAHNYARLLLSTTAFFGRAIRLYEEFGFVRTGETGELYGTPMFLMEKKLHALQ